MPPALAVGMGGRVLPSGFPSWGSFNRPGMSDPCGIIAGMGKNVSDGRKRAYKFRFYPSPAQATFLGRSFGAKRNARESGARVTDTSV